MSNVKSYVSSALSVTSICVLLNLILKAGDIDTSLSPYEKEEVGASLEKLRMLVKHNKALTRDDPSYQVRLRHIRRKI